MWPAEGSRSRLQRSPEPGWQLPEGSPGAGGLSLTIIGLSPMGPYDTAGLLRLQCELVLPVTSQPRQAGQALAAGF